MAFKRSAVRSRLSPPTSRRSSENSFLKRNGFLLYALYNVHAYAELLKVNVNVNMQLVIPVNLHAANQTAHDHCLGPYACVVVHIGP